MNTREVTKEVTDRLQDWKGRIGDTAKNVSGATDRYVRGNTWTSIALAAVVGCVIGVLIGRQRD